MNETSTIQILPYTLIVGQEKLKLALELAYIAPRIGGVLLSGQRGTGKSTAVRAFSVMMCDRLPVTLPINATEDRVVGGWEINQLMESKAKWQEGLIKEAAKDKLLYIDEVNLLDDHIVNIILDVSSTGVLVVQNQRGHDPALGPARECAPDTPAVVRIRSPVRPAFHIEPAEPGTVQVRMRFALALNAHEEVSHLTNGLLIEGITRGHGSLLQSKEGKVRGVEHVR